MYKADRRPTAGPLVFKKSYMTRGVYNTKGLIAIGPDIFNLPIGKLRCDPELGTSTLGPGHNSYETEAGEVSVGVPMFWPDWQDQKMRQHQNHFQTSGSSPPGSKEGSLCMSKGLCL